MSHKIRTIVVGAIVFDAVTALDLVGPLEVFAVANEIAERDGLRRRYRLRVLGATAAERYVAESGLRFVADEPLAEAGELDTLIVPGGAGLRAPAVHAPVVAELRRRAPRVRRMASVCTGIYALAAGGLLDGRRATTHWRFVGDVAARFPRVRLEADAIFVQDGRFFTSAGVTAGIDLALALVEDDLGARVALAVARELVVFLKRQGGQSQYSAPLRFQASSTDPIRETGAWIVDHLDDDLSVERLARRACLGARQFNRRFSAAFGVTPALYVQRARLDAARDLLLEPGAAVERVADATGFGSADAFSRAFERRFGVRPAAYRARFAAAGVRRAAAG